MKRSGDEGDNEDSLEQVNTITRELRSFRSSVEKRFESIEHGGIDHGTDIIRAADVDEGQGETSPKRKGGEDRATVKESYYIA
jgi:hypothetical protein